MKEDRKYRLTFTLTKEQVKIVNELKKTDKYCWGSMGDLIRDVLDAGLKAKGYLSE